MNWRYFVLLAALAAVLIAVFLFPAIPQNEAYHNFADQRTLLGVPNCLNVVSNVFFLIVGLLGIRFVMRTRYEDRVAFLDPAERWPYLIFFLSVAATAFGSSWYHLNPNDCTLLWDRLPMAAGFMSLVAAVVAERVGVKAGLWLLAPLVVAGAGSVVYWEITQARGHGDLRMYVLAQFGSLVVLLLLIALFPPRYTRTSDFILALAFYAAAKLLEAADRPIFRWGGIVSGHTLKHLAAAISTYWILRMLRLRSPIIG
ncbi:MAG: alkaline phytoceramidase [Candidatus Acidiferrales bacterium]